MLNSDVRKEFIRIENGKVTPTMPAIVFYLLVLAALTFIAWVIDFEVFDNYTGNALLYVSPAFIALAYTTLFILQKRRRGQFSAALEEYRSKPAFQISGRWYCSAFDNSWKTQYSFDHSETITIAHSQLSNGQPTQTSIFKGKYTIEGRQLWLHLDNLDGQQVEPNCSTCFITGEEGHCRFYASLDEYYDLYRDYK